MLADVQTTLDSPGIADNQARFLRSLGHHGGFWNIRPSTYWGDDLSGLADIDRASRKSAPGDPDKSP